MKTKVLVTGGAGFIGFHLIERLLKDKYFVVCVDNFDPFYSPAIKKRNIQSFLKNKNFVFYKENICNFRRMEEIFKKEKPDKVYHLAAKVNGRESVLKPRLYERTNIGGTLNLLELSKNHGIKNFIFASSSSVYGNSTKVPYSEKQNTAFPFNPYAATKKACELLIYNYNHLFGLRSTILRLFTVYGPRGRPDMAPFLFTDAIYKRRFINKFGEGKTKRDYTFIDDIVEGISSALKKDFKFEIINLGYGKPVSLNELIKLIEQNLGKRAKVKKLSLNVADAELTWSDISKAKKMLNYRPRVTIKEGIKRFIHWYLNNQKGSY